MITEAQRELVRMYGGIRYRTPKRCAICLVTFDAAKNGKFCSHACREEAYRRRTRLRVLLRHIETP